MGSLFTPPLTIAMAGGGVLLSAAALLRLLLVMADVMVSSVVYHRYLAHRSIELNRWLARGLTLFLQGMAFAPPLTFVASHRFHHMHTDSSEDPYSPKVHGFWRVLFFTPLLVTQWRRRHGYEAVARLSRGIPDPGFYTRCDRTSVCLTMSLTFATAFFLLLGWPGFVLYALQFLGNSFVGGWVNSVAHTHGERPNDNGAVNRRGVLPFLVNLCIAGEWLHNHHHHRPASANFGLTGELDTGFLVCRALVALRLASIRSGPIPA
jgi:stearoyl-CoA desaturase (delta-9 desaturase)